ncbi:MAG: polymerase [Treponema sp.]|jgi:hypothetical protein|nr:polymerase [Treponema sp.]
MKTGIVCCFLLFLGVGVYGQTQVDITGSIEWDRMEINAAVTLNLASAGIRLPTGRSLAEEMLSDEYPRLVQPFLLSIPVDSSTTLGDLVNRGEFSLYPAQYTALSIRQVPPALSTDLAFLSARYSINLNQVSAELIRHSGPAELMRTLTPIPVPSYTGIIILVSDELPIHGRNTTALAVPCIFPKIWDTNMNLIYERNMMDPQSTNTMVRYVSPDSIFRPSPSGLDPELVKLVGSNPLRIIARGVFGIRPTDPIIDEDDALLIISTEDNRKLLREGRVALVLNGKVLKSPLDSGRAK